MIPQKRPSSKSDEGLFSVPLNGTDIHIYIARNTVYRTLGGILPDLIASAVATFICVMRYPDPIASKPGYIQVGGEPALACVYHGLITGVRHGITEGYGNLGSL